MYIYGMQECDKVILIGKVLLTFSDFQLTGTKPFCWDLMNRCAMMLNIVLFFTFKNFEIGIVWFRAFICFCIVNCV